jgi:hypothetical protein
LFSGGHEAALKGFSHVLSLSSCVKMDRLDTDFSITPMQNMRLIFCKWIIEIIDSVRGDMCPDMPSHHREVSIPPNDASCPVPTPFGERIGERWVSWHVPSKSFSLGHSRWSLRTNRATVEWIAILPPSTIVGLAPTARMSKLIAIINRT